MHIGVQHYSFMSNYVRVAVI